MYNEDLNVLTQDMYEEIRTKLHDNGDSITANESDFFTMPTAKPGRQNQDELAGPQD